MNCDISFSRRVCEASHLLDNTRATNVAAVPPNHLDIASPPLAVFSTGIRVSARLVLATIVTTACATSPGGVPESSRDHRETETWGEVAAEDLIYPERIGNLTLSALEDFDDPALGVQLKYVDSMHSRARIDVYVYPLSKIETTSLTFVLEWEIEAVASEIEAVAQRQGIKAGEPASFPFGPSSFDSPIGLGLVLQLSSSAEDFLSYAFVAVRDHRFFKVRITIPQDDTFIDGYTQEVLDALYPAIRLRPGFAIPEFTVVVYRNVFLNPQHESCNIAGWMLYGVEMKDQIEEGNYLTTFERELAARKRALRYWEERVENGEVCASGTWKAMSIAKAAGYLKEYVFSAYDRALWPEPEGLDLEGWPDWANVNIEVHDPVIDPGVAVEWAKDKEEAEHKQRDDVPPQSR